MDLESHEKRIANEDVHWWFVSRRKIIKTILAKYFDDRPENTILEVGCGSGGNLKMLSAFGDLVALELHDKARERANSRNICKVKKGRLPEDIPFDSGFDLICILDVLEHIENDLGALQSLQSMLNKNGKLLITVPAYKFLWSNHDTACHHKRRYFKRQLSRLVIKSGLSIQYRTYFNTFLFPGIATLRLLNKLLKKNQGSDVVLPPKFLNDFLATIFSSETIFLPRLGFPFGLSILIIADKKKSG